MFSWTRRAFVLSVVFLFLSHGVSSQTIVSTSPANKRAVLEEFGGIYCIYCPHGHEIIETMALGLGDEMVLINYQTGPYAEPIGDDPDLGNDYSELLEEQSQLNGYPAATVNRHVFPGLEQSVPGSTALSRGNWEEATVEILQQSAPVNIAAEATLNISSRQLELYIEYYYTADASETNNRLHVAVLQNNVLAPQHGGNAGNYYVHKNLFREFLTGQEGHIISNTSAGSFGSLTYNLALPEDYRDIWVDPVNVTFAIFISENEQEILNGINVIPGLISDHNTDANLLAVRAPDDTCDPYLTSEITFRNDGQQPLTTCTIHYGIIGGAQETIAWNGELAPLEEISLTLDPIETLPGFSSNTFFVNLENPNDVDDPTAYNNIRDHIFTLAPQVQNLFFELAIRTDIYGYELYWEVVDEFGVIHAAGGNEVVGSTNGGAQIATPGDPGAYNSSAFVVEEFYLPASGCYQLRVLDDYGDGLCCYYGHGFYRLRQAGGESILEGAEFGTLEEKHFTIQSITASTDQVNEQAPLRLFPNPLKKGHPLQLQWPNGAPTNYDWQLFSVSGVLIQTGNQTALPELANQPAGYYMLQVNHEGQLQILPFIVQP